MGANIRLDAVLHTKSNEKYGGMPLVSQARIEANRNNSRRSTGPTSAIGKSRSRFNALKHGMTAKTQVLPSEDPALFHEGIDRWIDRCPAANEPERKLIERAAGLHGSLTGWICAGVAAVGASARCLAARV